MDGSFERDGEEEKDTVGGVAKWKLDTSLSPGRSSLQLKKLDFVKCLQSRKSPSFLRFRDIHGQQYLMSSEVERRFDSFSS